jgi:hypothetical protein
LGGLNNHFAIIKLNQNGPSELVREVMGPGTKAVNGVNDLFYFGRNGSGDLVLSDIDTPMIPQADRAVTRAQKRLKSLGPLLGLGEQSTDRTAIVQVSGLPANPNYSVFNELMIADQPEFVLTAGTEELPPLQKLTAINLVTGSCLFSNRALRLCTADKQKHEVLLPLAKPLDKPVDRIEYDDRLTLYELEAARRLGRFTGMVSARLATTKVVSVTLDIPRSQYYFYVLEAYGKGLISRKLLIEWAQLIDERHERICTLFEAEIQTGAELVGNHLVPKVLRTTKLDDVSRAISEGENLSLGAIKAQLMSDQVWALGLDNSSVESFQDLIHLSYAVELLRAGGLTYQTDGWQLGLEVDNFSEWKIFENARKLAEKIILNHPELEFNCHLLGLYPLERIFTSQETGRSELYVHDPGQELVDVAGGRTIGPGELVDEMYPLPLVKPEASGK